MEITKNTNDEKSHQKHEKQHEKKTKKQNSRKLPKKMKIIIMILEMEMESHGSVRIMKRQSQHKTTGQSLWYVPLSASHPLAWQAQACGRLTKAERLEGPMAPVVTTGGYSVEKTILTRRPCTGGHANLLCIVQREKLELCVSSLCQDHAYLLRITKKKLKSCELSLRRDHAEPSNQWQHFSNYARHPCAGEC